MQERTSIVDFGQLAALAGDTFAGEVRLVRHRDPSLDVEELYYANPAALQVYQAYQDRRLFECDRIYAFLGLDNARALFVGAYDVVERPTVRTPLPAVADVPKELQEAVRDWHTRTQDAWRYELVHNPVLSALEMRVVIGWSGRMTLTSRAQPVVELRAPGSLGPCPDYEHIDLSLARLRHLIRNEDANVTWKDRLSAVCGIYLLSDRKRNRLYVGKTSAKQGFWDRWKAYANASSGNVLVDAAFALGELDPAETYLSVLSVVPRGSAKLADIEALESRWKTRLRTRQAGLNAN
jgi:hypothetical protein